MALVTMTANAQDKSANAALNEAMPLREVVLFSSGVAYFGRAMASCVSNETLVCPLLFKITIDFSSSLISPVRKVCGMLVLPFTSLARPT